MVSCSASNEMNALKSGARDGLIAAVAESVHGPVLTANVEDFEGLDGINVRSY